MALPNTGCATLDGRFDVAVTTRSLRLLAHRDGRDDRRDRRADRAHLSGGRHERDRNETALAGPRFRPVDRCLGGKSDRRGPHSARPVATRFVVDVFGDDDRKDASIRSDSRSRRRSPRWRVP